MPLYEDRIREAVADWHFLGSQRAFTPSDTSFEKHRSCAAGYRSGKALALDTPIFTMRGWKTMGELSVGDLVFDERGHPCEVLYATDIMTGHDCFEVLFDDGEKIIADREHLWKVRISPDLKARRQLRKNGTELKDVYTTEELLKNLYYSNGRQDSLSTFSVVLADAVLLPRAELLVDPYTLGAWLGDGNSHSAGMTSSKDDISEIRAEIERSGEVQTVDLHRACATPNVRYFSMKVKKSGKGLGWDLGKLGVINNKHIPEQYLLASKEQRISLLCGLMDTDGFVSKGVGRAYFYNTNERLARQVFTLCTSLGIKVRLMSKRTFLNGKECKPCWIVSFAPTPKIIPFALSRKRNLYLNYISGSSKIGWRWIKSITPVSSVPVRCIKVSSPSSLFLAGHSFIPTHNTSHLLRTAILLSYFIPNNEGFVGRATGESLKNFVVDPFMDKICPPELIVGRPESIGKNGLSVRLRTVDPARTSKLTFNYIHDPQTGKFHLGGGDWGFFCVSQAEEITREEYMKLVGRLSRPVPRTFALSESNRAGKNWIFEDFFKDGDYKISDEEMRKGTFFKKVVKGNHVGINVRSEENRISNGGFVPDDYFDELRLTYSKQWLARQFDSFDNFSGKIWEDYSKDSIHNIVPFRIPEDWPWVVAIDVGGSAEWSIGVYRLDYDGNAIRTDGFHQGNVNARVIIDWLASTVPCQQARFIIDPENRVFTIQLQDDLGIVAEPAIKPIISGIHTASTWLTPYGKRIPDWADTQPREWQTRIKLGVPRFFVFDNESCAPFRDHMENYCWDENKRDTPKEDEHEHVGDEFRYFCMGNSTRTRASRPPVDKHDHLKSDPASYESAKLYDRLLANIQRERQFGHESSLDGEPLIWTPDTPTYIDEIS